MLFLNTTLQRLALGCVAALALGAQAQSPAPSGAPALHEAVHQPSAAKAMILGSTVAGAPGSATGQRVVAVGDHGVVLLSDDQGRTFRQARQVPVDAALTAVHFVDAQQGWAVGHWGVVLHTQDGGETWQLQRRAADEDRPLFSVYFFNKDRGVAVGLWGLVLTTDDGGRQWSPVSLPVPEGGSKADANLWSLFADTRGQLYAAAERGLILHSTDKGHSWHWFSTGYAGSFWTGTSPQPGTLVVGGLRGTVYRSTDDGATWQPVKTGSTRSVTALVSQGARVEGVGLDGLRLRSSDGGASFQSLTRADRAPLTTAVLAASKTLVLFSKDGPSQGDTP